MPRFRYEAVDHSGVPVHGTMDAKNEAELETYLEKRKQKLVSAAELSLESLVVANAATLPRLHQLRIGEQLREAILTGLPVHQAVRAIAAEPLSHPMLGVAPWFQVIATVLFVVALLANHFLGMFDEIIVILGAMACVVTPLIWASLVYLYRSRPKKILRNLATRLEHGHTLPTTGLLSMPSELKPVMKSSITDEAKARVAADLIPNLLGSNLRAQQFVMTLVGPLVLFGVVILGIHSGLLLIIPKFGAIFEDFGTQLPWITMQVLNLSKLTTFFGTTGWLTVAISIFVCLLLLTLGLSSGWAAQALESIPVFGIAFRWAMQARVARILAAMIRNECPYPDAIKAATAGSGFSSVEDHGRLLARRLENQSSEIPTSRELSGLPLSMLYSQSDGEKHEDRRAAIADTFQSLSEMLDAATVGQGRLLAVVIQFLTILFTAFIVSLTVLAMFLPLIRLLNDLS